MSEVATFVVIRSLLTPPPVTDTHIMSRAVIIMLRAIGSDFLLLSVAR